jgi:RNA polymerase sigma-70 factor (ECF subfamily)
MDLLHQQPAVSQETQTLTIQYRREIFQVAAAQIRDEFQPETWQAFWKSVVLGHSVDQVAESMSRSRGSVYTSRCRAIKRLKEKVQELDLEQERNES